MAIKNKKIGIVILATNAYFVLGLRFMRRFMHFYKGNFDIKFYFFSDKSPIPYFPFFNVKWIEVFHKDWREGTNSKFSNIIRLSTEDDVDYLFYFDADTNIQKPFTEEWFLDDLVGGEHYSNRTTLKDGAGFDRTKGYNSYVPLDSPHPYTYHYGAFFGGKREEVINMATTLREWQYEDQKRGYEPPVNDESYINKYFHYNKHRIVPIEEFDFVVSDKGGIGNTRLMTLNISEIENKIKLNLNQLWDIQNGKFILMTKHKQTWWDKEIKHQFEDFKSWIGTPEAYTKKWARYYIIKNEYNSILDIGCGMCDDYFEYIKEIPNIIWGGIDNSKFLLEKRNKEIPVLLRDADNTKFNNDSWEVVYSRHVLEHQESFKPILNEMIRVASKAVINVFFIKPKEKEIIHYNSDSNLYHNTYDKKEIEKFLNNHPKIKDYHWEEITNSENALICNLI